MLMLAEKIGNERIIYLSKSCYVKGIESRIKRPSGLALSEHELTAQLRRKLWTTNGVFEL